MKNMQDRVRLDISELSSLIPLNFAPVIVVKIFIFFTSLFFLFHPLFLNLIHEQLRALQPYPDTALPRAVPQRRERFTRSTHRIGKDCRSGNSHHADVEPAPMG